MADLLAGDDAVLRILEVGIEVLLAEAGAPIWQGPRDEPWGMRSVIVSDADGNLICFASTLEG